MKAVALLMAMSAVYLLMFPRRASEATVSGLIVSARTVIPAVFPYLVLSGMFVSTGLADRIGRRLHRITEYLFGLPGCCGGAILLGIICGFPVGGRMAGMLYQRGSIDREEATRLTAFADFCGPPYIITVLGAGILGSVKCGFVIYFVQTLLSLAAGIVLGKGKRRHRRIPIAVCSKTPAQAFTESVTQAAAGTLNICGYVTFFAVMLSAFSPLLSGFSPEASALIYGFFEMSGGILRLSASSSPLLPGTAIILWSGLSVLMQVASAASQEDARISMLPYLAVRTVTVPIGTLTVYLICKAAKLV